MIPDLHIFEGGKPAVLERLEGLLHDGRNHYVCFLEANLYASAVYRPELVEILNKADLLLADGVSIRLLARLQGRSVPERIPGPSFLLLACEYGLSKGYRHFFYGGAEGVPQRLAENLQKRFPGLQVAGTLSPPFRELSGEEDKAMVEQIEKSRPDLLWVGLGGPKQELWMASHLGRIRAPVMLGVGAAFDFHTGKQLWAPRWVRVLGMEWAYRMATGGKRTVKRNLWCVPVVARVLLEALCHKLRKR